jgi:hypothetical protein
MRGNKCLILAHEKRVGRQIGDSPLIFKRRLLRGNDPLDDTDYFFTSNRKLARMVQARHRLARMRTVQARHKLARHNRRKTFCNHRRASSAGHHRTISSSTSSSRWQVHRKWARSHHMAPGLHKLAQNHSKVLVHRSMDLRHNRDASCVKRISEGNPFWRILRRSCTSRSWRERNRRKLPQHHNIRRRHNDYQTIRLQHCWCWPDQSIQQRQSPQSSFYISWD